MVNTFTRYWMVMSLLLLWLAGTTPLAAQVKKAIDSVKIYPVPGKNRVAVKIISASDVKTTFQVIDVAGNVLEIKNAGLRKGLNTILINTASLHNGMYFLRIIQADRVRTIKMVIAGNRMQTVNQFFYGTFRCFYTGR